jgi:1,4-dihydroxy-2-naphthoate octaprenyltransferase
MKDQPKSISQVQRWILAIRPKTLTAAIAPVVVGWGVASSTGQFHWGAAFAALFTSIMIQIGTNLVNDVVDFSKGADTEARTGPLRVTQTGLLTPRQVWGGVFFTFGIAILAGLYLTWIAGWPVLVLGAACLLSGIAYTAGPYPLAYHGLGDIFVLLFFGYAAVGGTVFVVGADLPSLTWFAATATGVLTVNILVVNNIRDIETDRMAGRKNIPVVFGRKVAEWEFALMLVVAYTIPILLIFKQFNSPWVMLTWLTLPQGINIWRILRSGLSGQALNPILGQTAQLLLRFCLLFTLGLLI